MPTEASMSRNDPEKPSKKPTDKQLRQQRLAEALRANLRRRKAAKTPTKPDTLGKPQEGRD